MESLILRLGDWVPWSYCGVRKGEPVWLGKGVGGGGGRAVQAVSGLSLQRVPDSFPRNSEAVEKGLSQPLTLCPGAMTVREHSLRCRGGEHRPRPPPISRALWGEAKGTQDEG